MYFFRRRRGIQPLELKEKDRGRQFIVLSTNYKGLFKPIARREGNAKRERAARWHLIADFREDPIFSFYFSLGPSFSFILLVAKGNVDVLRWHLSLSRFSPFQPHPLPSHTFPFQPYLTFAPLPRLLLKSISFCIHTYQREIQALKHTLITSLSSTFTVVIIIARAKQFLTRRKHTPTHTKKKKDSSFVHLQNQQHSCPLVFFA